MPLSGLAQAFARVAMREGMSAARRVACRRVAEACWAHPDLVAGPGRLDTLVMARLPGTVLMKAGAEGVYCGALPESGLGFALKIDDGGKRAAEAVVVQLIGRFHPEMASLGPPVQLANWRGVEVGQMRPSTAFEAMLERLQRHPRAGGDPRNSPECKT
jgi:L-asparaginase II